MFKKAVQRGRSERWGESYSLSYVEPLSDARTKLADFFNILLGVVWSYAEKRERFIYAHKDQSLGIRSTTRSHSLMAGLTWWSRWVRAA
jgi:hypothetical protein